MVLVIKQGASRKEIAAIEQQIAINEKPSIADFDADKFNGIVKSFGDPITIQKDLRDE